MSLNGLIADVRSLYGGSSTGLDPGRLGSARKRRTAWWRAGSFLSLSVVALCLYAFQAAAAERSLPEFRLKLLNGKVVDSKNLRGKVTVIDVWATWCKPCIAEIPEYNRFYQEYSKKGVIFIAVASDSGTEAEVREAAKRLKMEYPVAAPAENALDRLGEFEVLPTTWVFDARGNLIKEFLGVRPDKHKELRALVDDLLKQPLAPDRRRTKSTEIQPRYSQ